MFKEIEHIMNTVEIQWDIQSEHWKKVVNFWKQYEIKR